VYGVGEIAIALREGESIGYVLTDEQVERLRTPMLALRDRVVVDIPAEAIERLTLTNKGQTQVFVRETARGFCAVAALSR
jgi:hypothetical protein